VAVLAALAGCSVPQHFIECQDDTSCGLHAGGKCLTNEATAHKFCAYPDSTCPDGYRWSDNDVESSISGACVAQDVDANPGSTATLTALVGGNGSGHVTSTPSGIDCPGTCTATFQQGAQVSLTATPSGSVFLGWSDACSGTGTCKVTLDADANVGALFGIPGSNIWLEQTNATKSASINDARMISGGDIAVAGQFSGTITLGGKSITSAGTSDGFVARLRATDGAAVWIKQLGGASTASVNGIDVDSSGNVIAAGAFSGSASFGGATFTSAGLDDVFVVKLSASDGSHLWSQAFGGTSEDQPGGVAVDTQGNALVAGFFYNTINPGTQPIASAGGSDAFIVKYASANGAHVWSKGIGGTGNDTAGAVAVDGSDNVVIAGRFTGAVNFGGGSTSPPMGAASGAFVGKYASASGSYLTAKASNALDATSVAADASGNMYVAGPFKGTIDVGGPSTLTSIGGQDIYLVKYSIAGAHLWSKSYGNASTDDVRTVRLDPGGNLLLLGTFYGSVSYGGPSLSAAGDKDIFLAHLSASDGGHLASMRLGGTSAEVAYAVAGAPSGDVFVGGDFTGFSEFGGQALTSPAGNTNYEGFALLLMPLN
jgi:hypothetical protein